MYKILVDPTQCKVLMRISDGTFIPLNVSNTDYAKFKTDILAGTELHNSDGEVMTAEETLAFIKELP